MEPQQDLEATKQAQAFNAKIEEVVGHLGVAVAAVVRTGIHMSTDEYFGYVRDQWKTLGRSFAELMDMEPPR